MADWFSQERIFQLILSLPAFVSAFALHEFAHAWMANRLGDDTPRRMGRLTLDPMAHLDPLGSLMFVFTQLSGYGIGWAKPVPFNPRNLSHPRRDGMMIAVAGSISNLLQMPVWLLMLWLFRVIGEHTGLLVSYTANPWAQPASPYSPGELIITVLAMGVIVNILLAAFNMIPFPPLDGHYILEGLGPPFVTDFFNAIRPWSFFLLILIANTGVLSAFIRPVGEFAYHLTDMVSGGHYQ